MSHTLPARRRGFTLLEVLVTVTIFALLFTVLMAGWFQALKAQSRLADAAQQLQQQQQLAVAARQLIAEMMSPRSGRGTAFIGTRRRFSAETSASLAPGLGAAPLTTTLQIEGNAPALSIRIGHDGQPDAVYPWRLTVAELRYLDATGRAHESWPPDTATLAAGTASAALPTLLQLALQFEGQARPMTLLVAPRASAWPLSEPTSPFDIAVK